MSQTLDHLFDRNVTWANEKTRRDPDYFRRMAEQQTPDYLWIGCSDSRVTANDVLGLDPGAVFVHRNIANIVHTSDLNILSVLEFAIDTLRVRHVIVCGHYGCGGVYRAIAEQRGAMLDHWLQPLTMLYRKHRAHFDRIPGRRTASTSSAKSISRCRSGGSQPRRWWKMHGGAGRNCIFTAGSTASMTVCCGILGPIFLLLKSAISSPRSTTASP